MLSEELTRPEGPGEGETEDITSSEEFARVRAETRASRLHGSPRAAGKGSGQGGCETTSAYVDGGCRRRRSSNRSDTWRPAS
eukprot:747649-Hanusia_phi.AAC.2